MNATPLIGTTFYSFTMEWATGQYTLGELLRKVAGEGVGPGVEIVGFQSIRGFPKLPADFVREFRDTMDELELVPTALGSNIDIAIRRDRDMTTDERVEYALPQIDAARALGFPVLRIQIGADPATLERLAPYAERAGVKLGMEIHAPEGPRTPAMQRVREAYERIGSDHLGFIPDFSSTMHRVTDGLVQSFVDAGLPHALADEVQRVWSGDASPGERLQEFVDVAARQGVDEKTARLASQAFTMNGHEPAESWADIIPLVFHVHAKFYEIDDDGNEPAIDYEANLGVFRDAGYTGTISSEWESHHWTPNDSLNTFTHIKRQQALIRKVFGMTSNSR